MKGLGTILLLLGAAGTVGGYFIGRSFGETEEEKKQNGQLGMLIGGGAGLLGGVLVNYLANGKPDTVNYSLHKRKKRVYDGICYEHRLDARINEHRADGKDFDKVVFDTPKPRSTARNLERKRIHRNTPLYNIHHNPA